jgi:glycosyltransferase involved in cell wall biosynthesis
MKILQVISYFNPKIGGDVNVVYNLSKHLLKKGHEITILTTDFEFDIKYANAIHDEGAEVIPFHCTLNLSSFFYSPTMKPWVKENIKHFDIIHIHNFRSFQNNVIHHYAKKNNIPFILQAHGSVLPFFAKQRLKKIYDLIWGFEILRNASKVIALTKKEEEQYRKMGVKPNKIEIIPNGIDISGYKNLPERGLFKNKYKINNNEKLVLYLGRIHKRKGIDFLIKSFSELIKEVEAARLVIVGPDDGYRIEIEKLITTLNLDNNVKLIGYINEKDKLGAYVDADALVYPSIFEIFGLVPFEAIMCGTPVIVIDDCGCGELVRAANCGKLVRYNDIDGLVQNIKLLINDQNISTCFIENGKKFIADNLTWGKITKKVEFVYEDCVCHF